MKTQDNGKDLIQKLISQPSCREREQDFLGNVLEDNLVALK